MPNTPFDFSAAMRRLCEDVCLRIPEFQHIRMDAVGVTYAQARRRVPHGLQAKLTPMRFAGGVLTERRRGRTWTVQRIFTGEQELLYLLTFYLPRFLDHSPQEKLVTTLHELYHISPQFNGDIRRFEGRCFAHTGSQANYDAHMAELAKQYLKGRPSKSIVGFLASSFDDLATRHGGVVGLKVPIPKLIAVDERSSA
ncbi:hypothetical protein [Stratiformator vulcanicus]|uniref:Phage metallopeptidase domain-containing protein n=1 Tax=Stratiformator vulcanicus TaxID=2527980 RepID=A0A517R0Y7_9PLAN|nr:hypothetical protein [Stratiformator vulcanicus]QDT37500.1 hypothetical protein Pan189_18800 [Stratiformator vulcanicus]